MRLSLPTCLPLGLSILVSSCFFAKKSPDEQPSSQVSEAQRKKLEEAQSETDIGRNMAGRLLKLYGTYPDEALVRYVNEVGAFVSQYSETPDRRYMFEIYNSPTVNAFACPGGFILISMGAIKLASNEAELAHILSHEVAHVAKQHMYSKLQKMNKAELDKAALEAGEIKDAPEAMKVRRRPDPEESEIGSALARYLSGNTAGLNALKAAKAGLSVILETGLGAELEYEADSEGTRYAVQAGYDPQALVAFLCRMETERGRPKEYCLKGGSTGPSSIKTLLDKTHPSVPDRVQNISLLLAKMDADQIVGAKGKKRFVAMKQQMHQAELKTQKSQPKVPKVKESKLVAPQSVVP